MQIDQEKFFDGTDFEKCEINGRVCFKAPDGSFCRMDHFANVYVIEFAENEDEARKEFWFDDADLFDDDLEESELIRQVQEALEAFK